MDRKSFFLYLGVGFTMTLAVWGLMGGCSSEKSPFSSQEESAAKSTLVSPPQTEKLPMEESKLAKPLQTNPAPNSTLAKTEVKTATQTAAVKPPAREVAEYRVVEHVVAKGETLWAISQKYHTVVESIMELNQMNSMNIHVGQRLRIKTKAVEVAATPSPAPVQTASAAPVATPAPVTSPAPVVSPIPAAEKSAEKVAEKPAASAAEKPAKKEEIPPQHYTGELLTHEVKDGETIASIAEQYQTSKSFLQDINGLTDTSDLQVGQILLVPEKTKP